MNTLVFAPSIEVIKTNFPNWAQELNNPVFRSIIFTNDGHFYTHGKFFKLGSTEANPYGLDFKRINNQLSLTVGDTTQTINLPSITGDEAITAITNANGDYILTHTEQTIFDKGPIGPSTTTIEVPKITTNKFGHVTDITTSVATLNKVRQRLVDYDPNYDPNDESTYPAEIKPRPLMFSYENNYFPGQSGAGRQDATDYLGFSYGIMAFPEVGAITADLVSAPEIYCFKTFNIGGKPIEELYTEIAHKTLAADLSNLGHVSLSNSLTTSTFSNGVAATPKAVFDALAAAKAYTDSILSANDAMLFKGTIGTGGTFTNLPTKNYFTGWTFRVITAGTYAGVKCEIGDLIIAIQTGPSTGTTVINGHWTVAQTNIDGAVITSETLTNGQLVIGKNNSSVGVLGAGQVGQVLRVNSAGLPSWSADGNTDTWRPIKLNSAAFLAGTLDSGELDLVASTGITLTGLNGKITITNSSPLSAATSLSFYNSTTGTPLIDSYSPNGVAKGVIFGTGLTGSLTDNTITLNHSNSITASGATKSVYSITYDANGHITGATSVDSLKNPNTFNVLDSSGATQVSYDGSVAKSIRFNSGTNTTVSVSSAGIVTVNSTNTTYNFASLFFRNGGDSSDIFTYIPGTIGTATDKRIVLGANLSGKVSTNDFTIDAVNTWRKVTAVIAVKSTAVAEEILSTSIGTADLEFSSDFGWDSTKDGNDGKIHIMWAEIDSAGNVTYKV